MNAQLMVFDWNEAARRIRRAHALEATAGLIGDPECTGRILAGGRPVRRADAHVFLASTWQRPALDLGDGPRPCFTMQPRKPRWHSGTYWPRTARRILRGTSRRGGSRR